MSRTNTGIYLENVCALFTAHLTRTEIIVDGDNCNIYFPCSIVYAYIMHVLPVLYFRL